ncbi:MAG TPA: S8 family serine peptidase [Fimbriimonas sp.]
MNRCWSVATLALLTTFSMAVTPEYVRGEVLLKMRPGYDASLVNSPIGAQVKSVIPQLGNITQVRVPTGWTVAQALKYYNNLDSVDYAEPNYVRRATFTPNDPMLNNQYSIPIMNVFKAWDYTLGANPVRVAVIDTGVDYEHPELTGKVVLGRDYANDDDDPMDDEGHGTHVAGIIGARPNNGIGIAGVGGNVTLLAIKVLDEDGVGSAAWSTAAIVEAADKGANVVNMSLGGYGRSQAEADAVVYATNKNTLVVAAAGNDNLDSREAPFYPSSFEQVLSVASTNQFDQKSGFSNYGPDVDVAAPGSNILSTLPDGAYGFADGTSMASPNAAGVAALMISRVGTQVSIAKVRRVMESTSVYLGDWIRKGRLDAYKATRDIIDPVARITPVSAIAARSGYLFSGSTVDAQTAGDGKAFSVSAKSISGTGMIADAVGTFRNISLDRPNVISVSMKLRSATISGASGMYWLWNYNTGSWQFVNNFATNGSFQNVTLPVGGSTTNYDNYIQNGQLRVMVRTILPARLGSRSYNHRMDYLALSVVQANTE